MQPHVLVVDDEAALCEMLSLYLVHKGFLVTTAGTIEQAMEQLEQNSFAFNMVILDLNLGGQDGLEVLRFVKASNPNLPIIIFTGLDVDENLIKKCLADRANGFMRKTDGLQRLFAEIQRHLHD